MKAINPYYDRQLTSKEIADGEHRSFVGGLWQEIGSLQFEFLRQNGLSPHHRLIDIGCGALRCGIPIIRFLEAGNYFGLDLNASLIEAAKYELVKEALTAQNPHLLVSDAFEMTRFGVQFDLAIAQSLFTHLNASLISRCLVELHRVLKPGGRLFASFLAAPTSHHSAPITHEPGGVISNLDSDPFHQSFAELHDLAAGAGFSSRLVGPWNHPRGQQMVELRPALATDTGRL